MKWEKWKLQWTKACVTLGKYKFVLLTVVVGLVLLLWPASSEKESVPAAVTAAPQTIQEQSAELERRLEEVLSEVDGAGEVRVILTLKGGPRQVLAQDADTSAGGEEMESSLSTVIVSKGSGTEEAVVIQQLSPQYQGALVVCSGGDVPEVRLRLVEAVSALTGLGADKISVCKGK